MSDRISVSYPSSLAENNRRVGAAELQSLIACVYPWLNDHFVELEELSYSLYKNSHVALMDDVLARGLEEIRSIKAECDARAREEQEYERSEKDCMWSDGCD